MYDETRAAYSVIPRSRIQSLDCLRAVACLAVIVSHTTKITAPGGWSIGSYGVGLFCVLSGYLITSILLRDEEKEVQLHLIKFLQRRCLRIVPAYFAVLLSCTLLMRSGLFFKNHSDLISRTLADFVYYATFTHNSGDGFALNHLWSISIEEQFYCLLPVLFLFVRSRTLLQIILVSAALVMTQFAHIDNDFNAAFIPLIFGTLLAINFEKISIGLNRLGVVPTLLCFGALALSSVLLQACPYGPFGSSCFLLLVWLAISKFKPSTRLSGVAYIGTISYGVYLVHMPLRLVCFWMLDRLGMNFEVLAFLLTACASIIIAAFSWELFEKRVLELRYRISINVVGVIVAFLSPSLIVIGLVVHALHGF